MDQIVKGFGHRVGAAQAVMHHDEWRRLPGFVLLRPSPSARTEEMKQRAIFVFMWR
jgi:hypothetical protein